MLSARVGSSGSSSSTSHSQNHSHNHNHNHSQGHPHAPIPVAAKKVVQSLKEIMKNHTEDEIYATLKECNMDPNDAVHKLMNQDTFHEVKRKRDKRKENGNNNDLGDAKLRPFGSPTVGKVLDRGGTRSNFVPRRSLGDASVSGGHQYVRVRENGSLGVATAMPSPHFQSRSQLRPNILEASNASASVGSSRILNGKSSHTRGPLTSHGNWAKVSKHSVVPDTKLRSGQPSASLPMEGNLVDGGVSAPSKPHDSTIRGVESSMPEGKTRAALRESAGGAQVSEDGRKFLTGRPGPRGVHSNYYPVRASFQQQHSSVNSKSTAQLEWKPKSLVARPVSSQASPDVAESGQSSPPAISSPVIRQHPATTTVKIEGLRVQDDRSVVIHDDRPVIIPDHLLVPEAEFAGLSFGSFDVEVSVSTVVAPSNNSELDIREDTPATVSVAEIITEQPSDTGITESDPDPGLIKADHTNIASPDTLVTSTDTVLNRQPTTSAQAELTKPEPSISQQIRQPSFASALSSQQEVGLLPPQFSYESAEALPQEPSRLPSFMPFSDPSTSYFSPVIRPGSDSDTRYQYVSSNLPTKFSGGNVALMNAGQNIPSSQELSQTAGVSHSTLSMPQPPYAYAAQPAGLTISPYATNVFGYQFVPPRYAYMHPPYQHNYSGNIGYPQPPGGSSYVSGARGYPPPGATAFKYAPLQYKAGTTAANAPHAVIPSGYGNFGGGGAAAAPGYATINPTVTAGSASSYDDMMGSQYKENSYYTPSQQGEGSAVWIPTPLSRDVPGMQANSFYNVHNQGQHAGYTHSQPSHPHGFASFYHLSQSAPGPNTHQLLQQPQALGSVGTGGSQAVIYQQAQHGGQLNWPSNYTNIIRNQ